MEHAQDLDSARDGPVEDQVLLEAGNGEETEVGENRLIGFVSGANAGHAGEPGERRVRLVKETNRTLRTALPAEVVSGLVQVDQGGRVSDDVPGHDRG